MATSSSTDRGAGRPPGGFWLDNQDGIPHTFTLRDVGFEIDAPGESQQRGEVDLEIGVYEVYCAVPGHGNMKLELVVEG